MMSISESVARIKSMQSRLATELAWLQQSCTHPNATGKYKANTGNWCEVDDSYWIDAVCPDCKKHWHIDSDTHKQEYREFPKRCKTTT